MFRIETGVKFLLIATLLCFTPFAFSDDDDDDKPKVDCSKVANNDVANYIKNGGEFKNKEERLAYYLKAKQQCYTGGDEDECKKSAKEFDKLAGEFGAACSKAGMTSNGISGSIACSAELDKCSDANSLESSIDEDSELLYDTETMAEQKSMCPAIPKARFKEIKEDLKATKEDVRELTDKVADLEQTQMENINGTQDQISSAKEQLQTTQNECREQQKALERGLKDQQKNIREQVKNLNQQVLALNDQIGQAETAKVQAAADYNQARIQIEIKCHGIAITKINKKREEILARVAQSTYNLGGLNEAIAAIGKTTRKQDQEEAYNEYKMCMSDAPIKKSLAAAMETYEIAARSAEQQKSSYQAQLKQVQQEIGVLLNNETARAQVEAHQDAQDLQISCGQSIQLAQERVSQAEVKAMNQQFMANRQLTEAKRDLELAKKKEKNIISAYRLAAGSSGSDSSPTAFSEVLSKGVSLQSSAETFRRSCCLGDVDGVQSTCSKVNGYLASLGVSSIEGTVALTPTERPTASGEVAAASASDSSTSEGSTDSQRVRRPSGRQQQQLPRNIPTPTPNPKRTTQ